MWTFYRNIMFLLFYLEVIAFPQKDDAILAKLTDPQKELIISASGSLGLYYNRACHQTYPNETVNINEKYDFIEEVIEETLVNKSEKEERTEKADRFIRFFFKDEFAPFRNGQAPQFPGGGVHFGGEVERGIGLHHRRAAQALRLHLR